MPTIQTSNLPWNVECYFVFHLCVSIPLSWLSSSLQCISTTMKILMNFCPISKIPTLVVQEGAIISTGIHQNSQSHFGACMMWFSSIVAGPLILLRGGITRPGICRTALTLTYLNSLIFWKPTYQIFMGKSPRSILGFQMLHGKRNTPTLMCESRQSWHQWSLTQTRNLLITCEILPWYCIK